MKINRDNYEVYFLDYHEGQLSQAMVQEVLLFVEMNPDLKPVFEEFEAVTLVADKDIVFEKKSFLKKNHSPATHQVTESNYEEFMIGETEGLLTDEQIASLDEFVRLNPRLATDRRLYSLAHLPSENEIVFENKASLKKLAIPVGLINADTFETFMAREVEGDLAPEEKLDLDEFILYNPHLCKDRDLYKQTRLNADTSIVFEPKNQLKHFAIPIRRIVYYALSAAASLTLVLSVYFLLNRNETPQKMAWQGNTNNTKSQPLTEPTKNTTNNTAASANNNQAPNTVLNTGQTINGSTNSLHNANGVVNSQASNLQLAVVERHSFDYLQARSAKEVRSRQTVDPQFTFIRTSQMYMNEQLEFYYNLKLSEQIQYARVNTKDNNPARTILNAVTGKAEDLFAFNQKSPVKEEKKNFSLWTFAELGVQTFNTVTSSELELKLRKDEEGKVVSYGIEGGLLDIERDIKK